MALAGIVLSCSILYLLVSQLVQQLAPNTLFYLRFAALLAFGSILIQSLYDLTVKIRSLIPEELVSLYSMFWLTALILLAGELVNGLMHHSEEQGIALTIQVILKVAVVVLWLEFYLKSW